MRIAKAPSRLLLGCRFGFQCFRFRVCVLLSMTMYRDHR